MTNFEATNFVFNKTDEIHSFSVTTPGHWSSRGGSKIIPKLEILMEMREDNDIKLHVEEVRKRRNQIKKP